MTDLLCKEVTSMGNSSNRMLFVVWAANLGGVQSSLSTRIHGIRKFGVDADVLFLHSGNGKDSFRGINIYISKKPSTIEALLKRKRYMAISFINLTPNLTTLRKLRFAGKLLYEMRGYSETCLKICSRLSEDEFGAIVVPSKYVASLIINLPSPHNIPIHVVYNAVDTRLFHPKDTQDIKKHKKPIMLWVGRLDRNKNFTELIHIVLALRKEGHDFKTWVVTDSKVSKELVNFRKAVKAAGLTNHIKLFENIPRKEMPRIYRETARSGGCVLSTSRTEGLQNSLLEGMACGCPVVTAAVGGNLEIVANGVNGATYPLGRPDLAAAEIAQLFLSTERRKKFITNGLRHVERRHTPKQHAQHFLEVLETTPAVQL